MRVSSRLPIFSNPSTRSQAKVQFGTALPTMPLDQIKFGTGLGYNPHADQTLDDFSGNEKVDTSGSITATNSALLGELKGGKFVTANECVVSGNAISSRGHVNFTDGNLGTGEEGGRIEANTDVNVARCEHIGHPSGKQVNSIVVEAKRGKVITDDVHIHGGVKAGTQVKIVDSYVDGKVTSGMDTHLVSSKVGSVESHRQTTLEDSTVEEDMQVVGGATMRDSDVKGNITVASPLSSSEKKIVRISGDSTVYGNITFPDGNGLVVLEDDNANLLGKVTGGEVKSGWDPAYARA